MGKWADFEIGLQFFDVVNNKPKVNQLSPNSNLKRKIVDMGDDLEIEGPGVAKRALSINVLNDKDSDSGREILGGDLPAAFASGHKSEGGGAKLSLRKILKAKRNEGK